MNREKYIAKLSWYFCPIFLLFWFALFYVLVLPVHYTYPDSITTNREHHHGDEFIGERAAHILFELDLLGPKPIGSDGHTHAVDLLLQEIEKIQRFMRNESFEMSVETQIASGSDGWMQTYRGVQNVLVKLQSVGVSDDNYLLLNSHFDTVAASPGAADDGIMVAVMLEVLRVLTTSLYTLQHPIVFLFNGNEEYSLLGVQAFITQHAWAANCRAFINLDGIGGGEQETLLRTFVQHDWLTRHYLASVPRPYGSSVMSELFQRTYNPFAYDATKIDELLHIPGLNIICLSKNYIYHTPYDKYYAISHNVLQAIGINVLALTRQLANAKELADNTNRTSSADGGDSPVVYYDFLRLFMLRYTNTIGIVLNSCGIVLTLLLLGCIVWRLAATSYLSIWQVLRSWLLMLLLQTLGCVLAFTLPILIAVLYDKAGAESMTLTWYTNTWLVQGLYISPAIFGLCMPTLLYLRFGVHDKLTESHKTQLALHAQAVLLAVVCFVATTMGLRSSYLFMVALFFHICSAAINLLSTLYRRVHDYWAIVQIVCQLLPFLYFSYITFVCLNVWIPLMGLHSVEKNPDLCIALICAMGAILCFSFILPTLSAIRYSCLTTSVLLLGVTLIFGLITLTPLGFPYRESTNMQRINVEQVQRIYYEQDGQINLNESGFHLTFRDRRGIAPMKRSFKNLQLQKTSANCTKFMLCALPSINAPLSDWLPVNESVVLADKPKLMLMKRTPNETLNRMRFDFELRDLTALMTIYVKPFEEIQITNYTYFIQNSQRSSYETILRNGIDKTPIQFFVEVEIVDNDLIGPHLELAIASHYEDKMYKRSEVAIEFLRKLPPYVYAKEWPSLYQIYVF